MRICFAVAVIGLGFLQGGCGAPLKSAGAVSYLFTGDRTSSLGAKLEDLCDALAKRTTQPSFTDLNLETGGCRNAGRYAVDYKTDQHFGFTGLNPDGSATAITAEGNHFAARSQVWLGYSLVDLAATLADHLQKLNESNASGGATKTVDAGVVQFKPTVGAVTFDVETLQGSVPLAFEVSGLVKIKVDGTLAFAVLGNALAVTFKSNHEESFKDSLIEDAALAVLIVPHAEDVYVDTFARVELYKLGGLNGGFVDFMEQAFGGLIKLALNLLVGAKGGSDA